MLCRGISDVSYGEASVCQLRASLCIVLSRVMLVTKAVIDHGRYRYPMQGTNP